jgi:hypothetical protein
MTDRYLRDNQVPNPTNAKRAGKPSAYWSDQNPKDIYGITNRAQDFMRACIQEGRPFYVQLSHYATHLSLVSERDSYEYFKHKPIGERHSNPEFAAMLRDLDDGVGRIMEFVQAAGIEDNTYIFLMGDNGGRLTLNQLAVIDEHKNLVEARYSIQHRRNMPLRDGKHSFYEGGLRVPFMVVGPGIESGRISDIPVTGLDLLPTFARLAGYKEQMPDYIDGGDIMPVLYDEKVQRIERSRASLIFHQASHRKPRSAIRKGDYKLIKYWSKETKYKHTPKVELYDLAADPGESTDLSGQHPGLTREMETELLDFLQHVNAETGIRNTKGAFYRLLDDLKKQQEIGQIATLASGWRGTIIAGSDESYVGWDVEIGDADNDGKNEVLTTGCPSSALHMSKLRNNRWHTTMLKDHLAESFPGMGLAVKVVDLDVDGANEVILGTGQEGAGTAFYYTFRLENSQLITLNVSRPEWNESGYTHNLAPFDIDDDGLLEVVSAYCGGGEVIRYDYDRSLKNVDARKIHHLSGSGEESLIADVDNDGEVELIVSNGFRKEDARVEIFEFDNKGELGASPRIVVDDCNGERCFYASIIVGDVDNDGAHEMVIGWKKDQEINKGTILGYAVKDAAEPVYTFAYDDPALDMAYFEKMMVIADADNDGKNELVVSTRGDNQSENITSDHLGHVFMYSIEAGEVRRELIVDLDDAFAESSWVDVGDADNDGLNEIVLATGKGDRTKKGKSYILLVEKAE